MHKTIDELSIIISDIRTSLDDLGPTAIEGLAGHKQEDWIDKAFKEYRETRLPGLKDKHEELVDIFRQAILKYYPLS